MAIFEPNDSYRVLNAYPVAKNSSETFRLLLNYYFKMERDYGRLDSKYSYWIRGATGSGSYWILGKTPKENEPRWSVVRNVLQGSDVSKIDVSNNK